MTCLDFNTRVDTEYKIIIVLKQIWLDFKTSFFKTVILKKSLWYIFGMAAYFQVLIYTIIIYKEERFDYLFVLNQLRNY